MSNLSSVSGEVEEEVESEFPAEYLRFGNVLLQDTVSMPSETLTAKQEDTMKRRNGNFQKAVRDILGY